ncbi:hypothetical protein [Pseudomonas uvaldensis]|uniref:hypothetical protein n=1 Tax=Pseudomonas uvaldensis TaxID=2878385 RepID=UPI001E427E24|nr:hypothetical protein [Pseudomonas uvaldensis]MCE0463448.1 hypothetical protein [Pseudomonas uvaldensis]
MQARILRGRSTPANSNNVQRLILPTAMTGFGSILPAAATSRKLTERMFYPWQKGATPER